MRQKFRVIYLGLAVLLIVGGAYAMEKGKEVEAQELKLPLNKLPLSLGAWSAAGADRDLDERTLDILRPQKYLLRNYIDPKGRPTAMFIAYYGFQQEGQMIHSPKVCLPGGGWNIESRRLVEIPGNGRSWKVNQLIIGKELSKISALYWYQGRGKIEASEYWERWSLLVDGVVKNRNDGALVRLTTVINPNDPGTTQRQVELAAALIPQLEKILP
jgi:EpsI family protein